MELSKRLNWIIEKTDKCNTIADIGTDHGYIAIQLIKRHITDKVIATDINKDPLEKAKINASLDNVSEFIDMRLGGGLKPITKNEADGIIIAGMGGNLIRDILEADMDKVKLFDYIILQPAQNPEVLREYLYTHSFEILEEDICFDEEKYYELFKVKYMDENNTKMEDIFYEISPIMLKNRNEVFREYIKSKIAKNEKIISFIKDDTQAAKNRKSQLINKNNKFKDILKDF